MNPKIAHLADLHLGFRQFTRQNRFGINQREADVALAFRTALDDLVEARPDLVIVAGDVFHSVRPANPAILDTFDQLRRLRERLPDAPVVIVAGNHDTPRSSETVTILRLFEAIPGIHVVAHEPRSLRFDDLGLSVTGYPRESFVAPGRSAPQPERGVQWNVLAMHGEIAGVIPGDRSWVEAAGAAMDPADLHPERWHYVALGHYHVATPVAPNAWYAGSLEYVSTTPWSELHAGPPGREGTKGWLLVTLDADGPEVSFRPVPLARHHVDLPAVFAEGMTAATLDGELAERVRHADPAFDGQVVRQVVYDVPRLVSRELDYAAIREYKTRALHYRLDLRRPAPVPASGVLTPGSRQTLREIVEDFLSARTPVPGVTTTDMIRLAREYLGEEAMDPVVADT